MRTWDTRVAIGRVGMEAVEGTGYELGDAGDTGSKRLRDRK